jgi:predicted AAA+ superfamily ATPase
MLLSYRLSIFKKRAKRKLIDHPKFYFFDIGVYQSIRPKGFTDSVEEIEGHDWRTVNGQEVDFVVYGPKNFIAIEVKCSNSVSSQDCKNLKLFLEDYPEAKTYIIYGGKKKLYLADKIEALPVLDFLKLLPDLLSIT